MELNESLCKELEWRQRVRCPDFDKLSQDLATGNFRPYSIAIPGAFTPQSQVLQEPPVRMGTLEIPSPALSPYQAQLRSDIRRKQSSTHNSWTATHLQVALVFCIYHAINTKAQEGVEIPSTYDGRQFCLGYYLKGVCN